MARVAAYQRTYVSALGRRPGWVSAQEAAVNTRYRRLNRHLAADTSSVATCAASTVS
jgi:hypothetical protein